MAESGKKQGGKSSSKKPASFSKSAAVKKPATKKTAAKKTTAKKTTAKKTAAKKTTAKKTTTKNTSAKKAPIKIPQKIEENAHFEEFETLKLASAEKLDSKVIVRDVEREAPAVAKPEVSKLPVPTPKIATPEVAAPEPLPVFHPVSRPSPIEAPIKVPAKELKQQEIEKAVKTATKISTNERRRRGVFGEFGWTRVILATACITTAIFAVAYFVNIASQDMSLQVAATQSGIDAKYPSAPRGYELSDVTSSSGKVTMHYQSDEGEFSLTEESSAWDSEALLNNFIKTNYGNDYTVVREQGLTLYMGGNWEAWVNGGILYKLNITSGSLTKKQMKSIATSLQCDIIQGMETITRFAPSPTGYIHIGNVRSAIYPYLIARKNDGKFILRIEDTDRERYVEGATELIEDTLKWLGLEWDEGPLVGGENGPYFQSERLEIYHEWARKLLASGRAYVDATPAEKVDEYRRQCQEEKKPFLYRNFRPEKLNFEYQEGLPIRFLSQPKEYDWEDAVMGPMHAGPETQDDIILIKKDGYPTYNFAHIVDDALMGVTHVMRGVEYLSSTPNYLALYEAFSLDVPVLVSLPHILAPTGNKKLGKRDGAKSVTEYRDDGVLAEAMLNYLACLGWNDGSEQEIYTKKELIDRFSLDRIQNSGARYDETKLLWLNGQWIRRIFDEQGAKALYNRTVGFWPEVAKNASEDYKLKVLSIIYDRLKTLSDLKEMTGYFFEDPKIDMEMLKGNKFLKKLSEAELEDLLKKSIAKLSDISDWNENNLQDALNDLLSETERKPAELFSLIRIAVSFAPFSPALNLTLETLGKNVALARLNEVTRSIQILSHQKWVDDFADPCFVFVCFYFPSSSSSSSFLRLAATKKKIPEVAATPAATAKAVARAELLEEVTP